MPVAAEGQMTFEVRLVGGSFWKHQGVCATKKERVMFSTIPSVFFETCRKFVMFPLKLFWRKYSITFFFNFAYCTVFFP